MTSVLKNMKMFSIVIHIAAFEEKSVQILCKRRQITIGSQLPNKFPLELSAVPESTVYSSSNPIEVGTITLLSMNR